jgi:iron complex outermembrane receptor protein
MLVPMSAVVAQARGASAGAAPTMSIRGTVVDMAGGPLSRAQVTATDVGGRAVSTVTARLGAFALPVPGRGRFTVQVRAVGYRPAQTSLDVTDLEGGAAPLRIALAKVQVLEPVQVIGGGGGATRGRHPGASELAGAVSTLSGEQISREQVVFAQELLRKVPGVYRAEFNQGIVAGDIGIRGFNSESEIASTKLLIDGIPSNLNSGVSEMNALFPLEISRIDMVRGTNDPRFGLFNLAGNVAVETPRGGSYMTTRLQSGSFGAREGQLLTAFQLGGFSQTLFAGLRESEGFRANSAMNKWSVSGKWFYRTDSGRVNVGVIARSHRLDTGAPGYLTELQSRSTPSFSPAFSAADGGTVATDHGSLHLDVRQSNTVDWSLRAYAQHFDRTRYVRFTAAGAQQERVEDERQQGAIAMATWRPASLAARSVVVTGGLDVQLQDNVQQRYRTANRAREATLRDYEFTLDNRGGYVQVMAAPVDRLQLMAGLRADQFRGAFLNRATNAELPIIDYGWIPQPKASATLRVTDRMSVYGNYGRAFQIGTGIATYSRSPLDPSKNDGVEIGFVSTPMTAVSLRAGAWQQTATDEVRLKFDNSGDSENIGQTRRRGIDVETTIRLPRSFSVWAAGTSQTALLVEPGLTNASSRGKQLNHVPAWTAKYGADWAPRVGVQLSFWSYVQSSYEITPQNNRGRWGSINTVNADVSWRWRALALGVGATNLFSRRNEYVWWDGTQTLHSPAAPRSLFLTLSVDR